MPFGTPQDRAEMRARDERFGRLLFLVAGLIGIAVIFGGWSYYDRLHGKVQKAAWNSLLSIADLKSEEVGNWIKERMGDAEVARSSAAIRGAASLPPNTPPPTGASIPINVFRNVYGYAAIVVADSQGRIRLKSPPDFPLPGGVAAAQIQVALHSSKVVFSGLIRGASNEPVYMWLPCPVYTRQQTNGPPDAALLMVVDPRTFLYPAVQRWPVPSRTGEAFLARDEGKDLVYLSELKYRSGAPLNLREPLDLDADLPPEWIKQGRIEGPDYRGARVLGVQRQVPGAPWRVVCKIDEEEVFASMQREAWQVGVITGLLVLSTLLAVLLLWRRQKLRYARVSESRFRTLIEEAPTAIRVSRGGKTMYVNHKFLELYGYQEVDELVGQSFTENWAPESQKLTEDLLRKLEAGEPVEPEMDGMARRRNGAAFPVHLVIAEIDLPDGKAYLSFITDITERRRAEDKIRRLNRVYAVLSAINELIVRERNPQRLLESACRVATETGEFRMAWIGMVDAQSQRLKPVASAGTVDGFLDILNVDLTDAAGNTGIVALAVRTGRHEVSNNIATDPRLISFQEAARKRGYGSVAAFPIRVAGKVVGANTFVAAGADFFDSDEVRLLNELASDIGFALEAHQQELERQRAEQSLRASEERFRLLIENASDIITVVNQSGIVRFVGPSVKRVLGYEPEQLLNTSIFDRIDPEDAGRVVAALRQGLADPERVVTVEYRIRHRDGTWQTHQSIGRSLPEQAADGFVIVNSRDVTEARRAEEQLRRHQEELEETVASRTKELSVAKDEAEKANRTKGMFLANISHEIRTPMNAILGYAQLLEHDSALGEPFRKKASVIRSSGDHLLHLVNDVLEMSRIEAGRAKLAVEPFDLGALLEQIRQMFASLTAAKGNQLFFETSTDAPRALVGDVGKVRQVVINLLSNANKFTEAGVIAVKTTARALTGSKTAVAIAVADSGRGIATNDLARLFKAFEQTESGIRAGGTGLGLAISRNFARMMGGDLIVTSELGKGSEFTFSFEAEVAQEGRTPRVDAHGANRRLESSELGLKALIVDDVANNRDVLADLLTKTGFDVRLAENAEEGMRIYDDWQPALVLMDLRMPGLDGIEAIRQLRAAGSRAVLVALTASGVPESRDHALEAGADELLLKPYHEAELLDQLGRLLGLRYVADDAETTVAATPAKASSVPLADLLKETSAEWRTNLREAALEARAERIRELASQIAAPAPLTEWILSLTHNFQYDEIVAAVENIQSI